MGLWYRRMKATEPNPFQELGAIYVPGDPNAPPKRWWNGWRWRQPWQVFTVDGFDPDRNSAFSWAFQSGETRMQLRRRLKQPVVAARIGPDEVQFVAYHEYDGKIRPLTLRVAENLKGIKPKLWWQLALFILAGKVAWV